jgi:hypothetical protein
MDNTERHSVLNTDADDASEAQSFIDSLRPISTVLAIKLYRMRLDRPAEVPVLPCLDHEAMLHDGIAPHTAAYVQDAQGHLHEIVYMPAARRLDLEVASTIGECTPESQEQLMGELRRRYPRCAVRPAPPSRVRGDYRVMNACRAQVTLREVLLGGDLDRTKASIDRLQLISSLMEKQSRSASWGARTVMTPLIAVAGFLTYEVLGTLGGSLGTAAISSIRYVVVTLVGGIFLYYGIKAVQLTEMANRVWKRSAEYSLILTERRKLTR